jgi:hypothetical protein
VVLCCFRVRVEQVRAQVWARMCKPSSACIGDWDPVVVKIGADSGVIWVVSASFLLSKSDRSWRSWAGECDLAYVFQPDTGSEDGGLCRKRLFLCCFWSGSGQEADRYGLGILKRSSTIREGLGPELSWRWRKVGFFVWFWSSFGQVRDREVARILKPNSAISGISDLGVVKTGWILGSVLAIFTDFLSRFGREADLSRSEKRKSKGVFGEILSSG